MTAFCLPMSPRVLGVHGAVECQEVAATDPEAKFFPTSTDSTSYIISVTSEACTQGSHPSLQTWNIAPSPSHLLGPFQQQPLFKFLTCAGVPTRFPGHFAPTDSTFHKAQGPGLLPVSVCLPVVPSQDQKRAALSTNCWPPRPSANHCPVCPGVQGLL